MNDAVRRFRSRLDGCDSSLVVVRADRPLRPKMLRRLLSLDMPTNKLASYKARTHRHRSTVNTLRVVPPAQACVIRQSNVPPLTRARVAIAADDAALDIDGSEPHFPGWRDWGESILCGSGAVQLGITANVPSLVCEEVEQQSCAVGNTCSSCRITNTRGRLAIKENAPVR